MASGTPSSAAPRGRNRSTAHGADEPCGIPRNGRQSQRGREGCALKAARYAPSLRGRDFGDRIAAAFQTTDAISRILAKAFPDPDLKCLSSASLRFGSHCDVRRQQARHVRYGRSDMTLVARRCHSYGRLRAALKGPPCAPRRSFGRRPTPHGFVWRSNP